MRATSRILTGALLLAGPVAFAQSSSATVANVPASARIFKPITLTLSNGGLNFGDIFADATGGTITLDPQADSRSTTGPALASTGTVSSALFTVGGKRNAAYAITLPANGTVTLTGPGTPMPVSFTASVNGGVPAFAATGLIPNAPGATQTFRVGGTLTLGANQADGDYAGTFNVMVAYN